MVRTRENNILYDILTKIESKRSEFKNLLLERTNIQ